MILAQIATHDNPLYQQWGLLAAAIGVCAVLLPLLWGVLRMKTQDTDHALLKIRSLLAGMFQQTFVEESRKVFQLVQTRLPYSLSQADAIKPQRSAFDLLCDELRELDMSKPDRDRYRKGLERALSGVIVAEVEKLLQIIESNSGGEVEGSPDPYGLRVSFEGQTERDLTFIAMKTAEANRTMGVFYQMKTWMFRFFAITAAAAALAIPWIYVDAKWAFIAFVVSSLVFVASIVCAIFASVKFHRCQGWLEDTAARYRTPKDWLAEAARTRIK